MNRYETVSRFFVLVTTCLLLVQTASAEETAASIAGIYANDTQPGFQVELKADGTYVIQDKGRSRTGPFVLKGSTIEFINSHGHAFGGEFTVEKGAIVSQGRRWTKKGQAGNPLETSPPMVGQANRELTGNELVAKAQSATKGSDDNIVGIYLSDRHAGHSIEFTSDGMFACRAGGQSITGAWSRDGAVLTLKVFGGVPATLKIEKDAVVDRFGIRLDKKRVSNRPAFPGKQGGDAPPPLKRIVGEYTHMGNPHLVFELKRDGTWVIQRDGETAVEEGFYLCDGHTVFWKGRRGELGIGWLQDDRLETQKGDVYKKKPISEVQPAIATPLK